METKENKIHWISIVGFIILFIIAILTACHSKDAKIIDSPITDSSRVDTVGNKFSADAVAFELSRELNIALDSLDRVREDRDSLKALIAINTKSKDSLIKLNKIDREKLAVAEYKLLRIREYNRIAAQGNNIKFLRGWINRVINH